MYPYRNVIAGQQCLRVSHRVVGLSGSKRVSTMIIQFFMLDAREMAIHLMAVTVATNVDSTNMSTIDGFKQHQRQKLEFIFIYIT